ncbi:diguanylate cyclase domain-containing protein [Parafrankia sp. EUN1f]|uniref:diguanylate cyclase domain-containing protein n=1 Tax=Parafrankia sp. EUN1f TaxID=102897 RepID=UPI0001C4675A|nr:diguanylate cyclase [Parafrankia sp. EUN1f]EFC82213.1 diguanylate cyclase with PAS/PAC sensor [Parafrankia sp. EUN1f]
MDRGSEDRFTSGALGVPGVDDRTLRGRVRRAIPRLISLAVFLLLVGIIFAVSGESLAASERERLSDRAHLVEQTASYTSRTVDPKLQQSRVDAVGFSLTDRQRNAQLLRSFLINPASNPNFVVALLDHNGRPLVSQPVSAKIPVGVLGDAWPAALAGRATRSPVFVMDGLVGRATAAPVGDGRPWAVLVTVATDALAQRFDEQLGSLGLGPGGLTTVDSAGVAASSWDPALVGRRVIDPAVLRGISPVPARVWTSGHGADEVTNIAARQTSNGYTNIFQQRSDMLYSDLRKQQRSRNLTVISVGAVAVLGLAVFGLRREVSARRASERLDELLRNTRDLIAVVGPDGVVTFLSPSIERLLGYHASSWLGQPLAQLAHPADRDRLNRILTEGGALLDVRLCGADGAIGWFDLEAADFPPQAGLAGVLVTCHEIGERKKLQDRLGHQARHDLLTGLANRSGFVDRLASALAVSTESSSAVLYLDLDGFKPINDSFGHAAGDRVLAIIGARLAALLREGDLAGRLGGDEFAMLLRDSDLATASLVADRVISAVAEEITLEGECVQVGASVGIAMGRPGRSRADELIHAADTAMYAAKRDGGGRVAIALPTPSTAADADDALYPRDFGGPTATISAIDATDVADSHSGAQPSAGAAQLMEPQGSADAELGEPLGSAARRRPTAHPWWPRRPEALRATYRGEATAPQPRAPRIRFGRIVPLLVAALTLFGIASLGLWQNSQALRAAEARRMDERLVQTARMADYISVMQDPQPLVLAASASSWSPTDLTHNRTILQRFAQSPAGGPDTLASLTSLDGRTIAAEPAAAPPMPIATDSPQWQAVRAGRATTSQVVTVDGTVRLYTLAPVLKDGRPVAVLALGRSAREALPSFFLAALGGMGLRDGGSAVVDRSGRASFSSNPDLAGRPLVNPADLADLRMGRPERVTVGGDSSEIMLAAPIWSLDGAYFVFRQPAAALFAGLREGQGLLAVSLFGTIGIAILGIAVSNARRENALRREESQLNALLHNADDIVIVADRDCRITFASSDATGLLGQPTAGWVGKIFPDLSHPEDASRLQQFLGARDRERQGAIREIRLRACDGYRWFDIHASEPRYTPVLSGIVLTCHEIGERRQMQAELAHRASHDPLTGLPNRAAFNRHLAAVAEHGQAGTSFGVLFIDLDNFKPVNDRFGHAIGDDVLRVIGARIGAASRRTDMVSRLGGDEFAVLIDEADADLVCAISARILESSRQPIALAGTTITLGATVGIALCRVGTDDPETALRNADKAMYRAKRGGRGRYALFADRH